jgi:hypothetical protein
MDYEFENTYENGLKLIGRNQSPRGLKLVGEDGWIFVNVHGAALEASRPEWLNENPEEFATRLGRSPGHHQNFVDCVKDRQQPVADAGIGCRTATICHLNNIAMLVGRKIRWDPQAELIKDDAEATALLGPSMRSPWSL